MPAVRVGQPVLARWKIPTNFVYYPGRVTARTKDGLWIHYADGDRAVIPRAAVIPRGLKAGDFANTPFGPAAVTGSATGGGVTVRILASGAAQVVPLARVNTLLRADTYLGRKPPKVKIRAGERVLAKWDQRAWWVGTVKQRQGEALLIAYDDGTKKWLPGDRVTRLNTLRAGAEVYGVNTWDKQVMPGRLLGLWSRTARLRYFDGFEEVIPLRRLVTFRDQIGIDNTDPCRRIREKDLRPHVATLRRLQRKRPHFYAWTTGRAVAGGWTKASHIELGFVHWIPKDRKVRPDWKPIMKLMALQIRRFLLRELGPGLRVTVKLHPRPVVGTQTLEWYKKNLVEAHAWHRWAPTGDAVRAIFPRGARAGRHRVTVVIPDAPGISGDSSGVEQAMGFVRVRGKWFGLLTRKGVAAVNRSPGKTTFSKWRPDYLPTTIAHEILHTLGLPHSVGDPFSVMHIGPWYPITRKEVHVSAFHKRVLRSPFRALSLRVGVSAYLTDPEGRYLRTIARLHRLDSRLLLHYARGPGFFKLLPLLRSYGPKTRNRFGGRKDVGERAVCRAYLSSFIEFVLSRHGTSLLSRLFDTPDGAVAQRLSTLLKTPIETLQRQWHHWLRLKLRL